MDRFNWNHPNADYDYYSQAYLEEGQHISQPEIGQTSGGIAASGRSCSDPALSQPQLYPDFNFPQWIPSSPGSDLKYLLPSPQPTPLENTIQNDVPPESSNAQPPVKKQKRRSFAEVEKQFLAGLDKYAQGHQLKDCSATINFYSYITQDGYLHPEGTAVYNRLEQKDKDRVDQALADRKVFHSRKLYSDNSTGMRVLEGLEAYASGAPLKECSATIKFSSYFSSDGHLQPCGKSLYNGLKQEDKDRIDQALKDRKENSDKIRTNFLEGLGAYASGAPLKNCSKAIHFDVYVSTKGYLHERGKNLYDRLEQGDKDRVLEALLCRQTILVERTSTYGAPMDEFLGGLEAYARGAPLKDCSASSRFYTYVTSDGRLREAGKRLYMSLMGSAREALVNKALADRRKIAAQHISGDLPDFLKALEPYSNGLDLLECGIQLGLKKMERYLKVERYLTPEGGLTAKGELLIENLPPDEQLEVLCKVGLRRQLMDPSAQEPGSPWQLPSSMLEKGGMDQAAMTAPIPSDAMVDPMQTEAMWTSTWQLTGQTVPGPSASAVPPIPYYDNEAIGADFQPPLWLIQTDNTERTGPPHQPGDRGPDADQYPWQGVRSDSSVGSTNENPYGKSLMLVHRMRGG
ncbi:MAG: hypothetical protein P8X74_13470 [Reinekea sp.]